MKDRSYFYEEFADQFDITMSRYDLERRLDVVFNEFLGEKNLSEKLFLDAGCGTGWFSQKAMERGARVVSMDMGPRLLSQVRKKTPSLLLAGSVLRIPFPEQTFDFILSTEVIEHTPDPRQALQEMARVLKPKGHLILTVPNRRWKWTLAIANILKLRPYQGYENWVWPGELQRWLSEASLDLRAQRGLHAFPFLFKASHPLLRRLDPWGSRWKQNMINLCVLAERISS